MKDLKYGVPKKSGVLRMNEDDWKAIVEFIQSRKWYLKNHYPEEEDKIDPLLQDNESRFGFLLMGFDFHLTDDGPKLIEINTNAGGLPTAISLERNPTAVTFMEQLFYEAVLKEFNLAKEDWPHLPDTLQTVAIVDEHVAEQQLYPEMVFFANLLKQHGIDARVVSPEDMVLAEKRLCFKEDSKPVDLLYNRITDFRFKEPAHEHIRAPMLEKQLVVTPNPNVYIRTADKRNLSLIDHPVVPKSFTLSEKPLEEWAKIKKGYVFKPPSGNGSKGVYRGDKLSKTKLAQLSPQTVVQEYCAPPSHTPTASAQEDDPKLGHTTKYDIRVYTCDTTILGVVSRHFTGQVMEMRSDDAGFKAALPEGICCFPVLAGYQRVKRGNKWLFEVSGVGKERANEDSEEESCPSS
eukprot:GCRY01003800.1.p1 GENE.GCRY01003800.1~~GCRY01003800.1.p1  ORF type:complete len:406 (-),score=111.19 GCRY01003800.1:444-1661(-)